MSLENVKIGDELIYGPPYSKKIGIVERVTPTQFTIGHTKFSKKDGRSIGAGRFNTSYAKYPIPEEKERLLKAQRVSSLQAWVQRVTVTSENVHFFDKLRDDLKVKP